DPSQRSSVSQKVPRTLADANRAVVLNAPFAEPHSRRTDFRLFASTERALEQTEKSPPTSVSVVRPPAAACCTWNLDETVSATRPNASVGATRWFVRRATVNRTFAQLPEIPFESVNVMIPFATSTTSPEFRTNC